MARRQPNESLAPFSNEDLDNRFQYHQPEGAHLSLHETLRAEFRDFANILKEIPAGRERSLALTKLEECGFWAHAAVARINL